ncbi:MAG TPA: GNAT family N-acetyltransferase [Noviherbaspirillum sp.]|uniref:GNAT family N-acetyltransferase n=1 Tax=Noviherbaspirillum sp. TaxID=1926288 RepID=UPI002DDD1A55|nr:GNAT family N-acetyltransferase [Noviherbaspirillum sp.]HEV2611376.1 GNAT family N-acetyltransferase [Noviherbaspirillum sp.]
MNMTQSRDAMTERAGVRSDIAVREAVPGDAEALAVLLAQMDDEPSETEGFNAALTRQIMADMESYPDFKAYLALDEAGVPVGTFSLMVFCSLSHHGSRQALLDAVVVSRERRGEGVGEAMLQRALHIAAGSGCYKLSLSSNIKRKDAHRFYERLGFSQHGVSFGIELA